MGSFARRVAEAIRLSGGTNFFIGEIVRVTGLRGRGLGDRKDPRILLASVTLSAAAASRSRDARLLILATDTDGVYFDWGTDKAKKIERITPGEIEQYEFDIGSMGPKVEAACDFVRRTGERAVIGALSDLEGMVAGEAGTQFTIE